MKNVIPDLKLGPFKEAFMYCVPRPKLWMQVPPWRSCFHNPQEGIEHQTVILALPASGFSTDLCQHRSDYGPFFMEMPCLLMQKTRTADGKSLDFI